MSDLSAPLVDRDTAKEVRHLPVDPWHALRVHFGMLLGVDDFETIDAYHRGKMWLHNAWLHGAGVIWGLGVTAELERGELRVAPGLALDDLGRELHLDLEHCVDVGRWLEARLTKPGFELPEVVDGRVTLEAHVTVAFRGCLARPVPALLEPCDGAGNVTAFSRVLETVEALRLVPAPAPRLDAEAPPPPYHRLRILFGLDAPRPDNADDQAVAEERTRIEGLPAVEQPAARLAALRRFGALDVIELGPPVDEEYEARSLFPAEDPAPLVLAHVPELVLERAGERWRLVAATIDPTARPVLIATSTIQELCSGPTFPSVGSGDGGGGDGGAGGGGARVADAGGPRADPASVRTTPRRVRFELSAELHPASVVTEAFSVTVFDENEGWDDIPINDVAFDAARRQITLELGRSLHGRIVRLIARGSGPTPLLGRDLVPLAGAAGGPPGSRHTGQDFVSMQERAEP